MNAAALPAFDRVLTNCRVIDPANGIDGRLDVGISGGRIAAIAGGLADKPHRDKIDLDGAIVAPGFIDPHVHVYEWVTDFGVPADAAGVHAGATTIVDQGSSGIWTFRGFEAYVIDKARTDVRAFVSINVAGALRGGMEGPMLHGPEMVRIDELVALAREYPRVLAGIKCHGESGSMSHWDVAVLARAAEAGRRADLPLYVHTGELFPVVEARRPATEAVMPKVLALLKPGDMVAHVFSAMPDGAVGRANHVPDAVLEARARGVLFDLGHGINLSFPIARMMMEAGFYPDTISSDVHGDFDVFHDFSKLDYSFMGAVNKLIGLGMPLVDAIARVTSHPARFLRDNSIGSLALGNRADITVLEWIDGDWTFRDGRGEPLQVTRRLLPKLVFKNGEKIVPDCSLMADLVEAEARPRGLARPQPPRHAAAAH